MSWFNDETANYLVILTGETREWGAAGSAAQRNHLVAFCNDGGGRERVFNA